MIEIAPTGPFSDRDRFAAWGISAVNALLSAITKPLPIKIEVIKRNVFMAIC